MVAFSAIGLASMGQLATIGLAFISFGIILQLLPKWGHFKWCVKTRQALIEEVELNGDFSKVVKLRNEIYVIEKKLPMQGKLLAGLGTLILIVSCFISS